jgi:hypothetical protein
MMKEKVQTLLQCEPFAPLRIHLVNGESIDVPFRDAARLLSYGVLVFIGLKEGSRQAKDYDRFGFEQIARIEQRPTRGSAGRRKKAS